MITIQSQSDDQVTLVTDGNNNPNDTVTVRWTPNHPGASFAEVNVTVIEVSEPAEGSEAGDLQFLKDLYVAMDGNNWDNNTNWNMSANSLPANNWGQSGGWFGVYTGMRNGERRITQLDLQSGVPMSVPENAPKGNLGNGLTNMDANGDLISGREFPESVENLTKCEYFNVKTNSIRGPIPQGITNLVECERILLSGHWREPDPGSGTSSIPYNHPVSSPTGKTSEGRNQWSGEIPRNVGNLQKLVIWESQQALITGTIPPQFGQCPDLEMLMLMGPYQVRQGNILDTEGWVKMHGTIPPELGNATKLRYLFLGDHELEGGIPSELGNLTDLKHLRLPYWPLSGSGAVSGGLTGSVPSSLVNCDLRLIIFSGNGLSGSFPSFLLHNKPCHTLRLEWNNFSGTIPTNVSPFSGFNVAAFGNCNFSGQVPAWLASRRIIQLNLDNNNFSSLHSDFYNPQAGIWGGTNNNGRIRNVRLNGNSNLTGHLPRPNWENPENLNGAKSSGAIAAFQGTGLTTPGPMENGRETVGGSIVQKTRADWFKHHWTNTQGL